MQKLDVQPSLTERVYHAILDEIAAGTLAAGSHLKQEQLAERLGVSRQPVQQAMALLKADGIVQETGRRGLWVAPLDPDLMSHHYEVRAALDGLAARLTAERAKGDADIGQLFAKRAGKILDAGTTAVGAGNVAEQVRQDMAFHQLVYEMSGNPLLARTAEPHWRFLQRAMGEITRRATLPQEIWRQHAGIVEAVAAGDANRAEERMIAHVTGSAEALRERLTEAEDEGSQA